MLRNRSLLILLFVVLSLFIVSPALAQTTSEDINFQDILDALGPRSGVALLYDILLYLIFFFGLINTFLIPDKQIGVTVMNFTVMGLALASKLLIEVEGNPNPSAILVPTDFAVLPINVAIFVIPLLMAGMLRSVKGKRSNAMFPALIMGLMGGAYFFLFWAQEQNNPDDVPQPGDDMQQQGSFIIAMAYLGWLGLRRRFQRWF